MSELVSGIFFVGCTIAAYYLGRDVGKRAPRPYRPTVPPPIRKLGEWPSSNGYRTAAVPVRHEPAVFCAECKHLRYRVPLETVDGEPRAVTQCQQLHPLEPMCRTGEHQAWVRADKKNAHLDCQDHTPRVAQ